MPHVLILDDIAHRLDVLRDYYQSLGYNVVTVSKYHDCCASLSTRAWDLIHLDHDLADWIDDADCYVDGWGKSSPYNGSHVVKFIIDNNILVFRAVIHSVNPAGAHMRDDLIRYGVPSVWSPFTDPGWNNQDDV